MQGFDVQVGGPQRREYAAIGMTYTYDAPMALSDRDTEFLKDHHQAAMVTVGADGRPKAVRVAVALVNGNLWSSGTDKRARTRRLRRDPRCTLFVFDSGFSWLTLETTVTILDGPGVVTDSVRLFREMQGRPTGPIPWFGRELSEEEFGETMVKEGRVIYQFDVARTYGIA